MALFTVTVSGACITVIVEVNVVAAAYVALPACVAVTVTVPAPVIVTVEPDSVACPLTPSVTASPELAERAQRLAAGGPKLWAGFIEELRKAHLPADASSRAEPEMVV